MASEQSTAGIECPSCGIVVEDENELDKVGMEYRCPGCWSIVDQWEVDDD